MKSYTDEDKAKAYDKFVKELKSKFKDFQTIIYDKNDLEKFFPELTESEDERIRKDLIQWINEFPDIIWRGHYKKDVIAWLEKQGKIVDYYEDRLDECACKYFNKGYKHALEKQGEHCPIWSEEDKKMFVNIKACLRNANKDYSREVDWLKSIKPQPKKEWSEEDEKRIKKVMHILSLDGRISNKELETILDWLKSLKSQNEC